MIKEEYYNQVQLLLNVLPEIAKEKIFALKGGTAINLFYNNMPRISVDIDLDYILFDKREEAYKNINSAMIRISNNLNKKGYKTFFKGNPELKLFCFNSQNINIKIEPNYVIRGIINPIKSMKICNMLEEKFGYIDIQVLSKSELYGGKICAALDRQHPRDLFDIWYLLKQEKNILEEIKKIFIVYALGHPRNLYELFDPIMKNQELVFNTQFEGMTDNNFSYKNHVDTFKYLYTWLRKSFTEKEKTFLLDFVRLQHNFTDISIQNIEKLPAIQWKIKNLEKLKQTNIKKFEEQYNKLAEIFKYQRKTFSH